MHPLKDTDRLVLISLEEEPPRALRQEKNTKKHDGGRNCDDAKHDTPVSPCHPADGRRGGQPCIAQEGKHNADGDH